jgi:hypothetical protein
MDYLPPAGGTVELLKSDAAPPTVKSAQLLDSVPATTAEALRRTLIQGA